MKMMTILTKHGLVAMSMAVAASLHFSTDAQAGLRAYWPMNEGSGLVAYDSSAFGNDGYLIADTVSGSLGDPLPGPTTPPDWITGPDGSGALLFSTGTNNYNNVSAYQSPSLQYLGQAFSFSMWIRQDSRATTPGGGGGYPRIISTPNYEIELGVPSWEYDYLWNFAGGPFQTDVGSSYIGLGGSLGQWYQMVITYDGTDLKKYFNGMLVDTHNQPGVVLADGWAAFAGSPLKLGSQTWPNKDWFIGALDDVAIWGGAYLDAAAVASLYNRTDSPLTVNFVIVPEPAAAMMLVVGGLFATAAGRRNRR